MNGFSYDRLDSGLTPRQRLDWLTQAARNYSPQPYEQLASYYVANGNADQARKVRLESIRRSYSNVRHWAALGVIYKIGQLGSDIVLFERR